MKTKIFCLIILTALALNVSAQETTTNADTSKQFRFPKHALQFQIEDFIRFSDFNGGIISGKYHFNNPSAIRLGISYSNKYDDQELEEVHFPGDSTVLDRSINKNAQLLKLKFHFLRYLSFSKSTKYFIGAGPNATLYWQDYEIEYTRQESDNQSNDHRRGESKNWEAGIEVLNGVEWFFHPSMSLSLEYSFLFRYNRQITKEKTLDNNSADKREEKTSKAEGWHISSNPVKFGLSVYF